MSQQIINPKELYDGSSFGMSHAIIDKASNLIFIAGQVDWDHQYKVTNNTVEGQFKKALENLSIILEQSNSSIEKLLHMRIYIRGEIGEHMQKAVPILLDFLGSTRPAITGIGVVSLASPDTLVEIEATASPN